MQTQAKIGRITGKHLMIDKANATMLAIVGVASFLVVFSLVSSKTLISQSTYQGRVIKEKDKTLHQLIDDNKSVSNLVSSYGSFASEPENILGGNPSGTGPKDGDNPKIVLDALPSKYDFPGLISSVEKVLKDINVPLDSVGGSDDEIAQEKAADSTAITPVEVPFIVTVKSSYDGIQNMLMTFEKSIRPINVKKLTITAEQSGGLKTDVDVSTFYQPAKQFKIKTKVVE